MKLPNGSNPPQKRKRRGFIAPPRRRRARLQSQATSSASTLSRYPKPDYTLSV